MMSEKQSILIVDDEKNNRALLSQLLKNEYRIILAKNGEQAIERVHEHSPDLILLDVLMPVLDGYETIKRLKNDDAMRNIPVIFISGLDSILDESKGLCLGALDYITKPFHPDIVQARVRNHLSTVRVCQLLEKMALLDGLTEIPNRRSYDLNVEKEWCRCMRTGKDISLIMIDIDYFKRYNDHYGHGAGDHVLQGVAQALQMVLQRPGDIVYRYGGEEFVVLLPETDAAGGQRIAQKMRKAIYQLSIDHSISEASDVITISLGGRTEKPNGENSPESLLKAADVMLYRAKDGGKNQVCWS